MTKKGEEPFTEQEREAFNDYCPSEDSILEELRALLNRGTPSSTQ